jgi:thiol:disulfide interchange protein DsbA
MLSAMRRARQYLETNMNSTRRSVCLGVALCAMAGAAWSADTASDFREGINYSVLPVKQPSQAAPGKVEVTEVFSYGCPACNQFQPMMARLKAALPKNAQLVLVHASWSKAESWPLFQRAFVTAQVLGIAEQSHEAMFAAVWGENGPLAVADPRTGRLKQPQPTIEDVARFYASRHDCTEAQFLAASKSFAVDTRMRQFDTLIKGYRVPSTPCVVVGGLYRIEMSSLHSVDELLALVRYLVQKAAA